MKQIVATLVVILGVGLATTARANTIVGPVYPGPGNPTFTAAGNVDQAGGVTWTFSNFNTTGWDFMAWAALGGDLGNVIWDSPTGVGVGAVTQAGNQIDYHLTPNWVFPGGNCGGCPINGQVELIQTFTDLNNNQITPPALMQPGAPGFPAWVLGFDQTTLAGWGGGFRVNNIYLVNGQDAAGFFFNNHGGPGGFQADLNGGFYFEPNAVPEPSSLLLLGTGLAYAGRRFRRRT